MPFAIRFAFRAIAVTDPFRHPPARRTAGIATCRESPLHHLNAVRKDMPGMRKGVIFLAKGQAPW
jgi:hypothetical protein